MKSIPRQMRDAAKRLQKALPEPDEVNIQYHLDIFPELGPGTTSYVVRVGSIYDREVIYEIDRSLAAAVHKALNQIKSLKPSRARKMAEVKKRAEELGCEVVAKGGAK